MDIYAHCPDVDTPHFTIRLIRREDGPGLFRCYHDKDAVALMNDDNCDFGFYADTEAQMCETVGYWVDFYEKRYFVRFAVVDKASNQPVGTIEGFSDEIGVLRIDLASDVERTDLLTELVAFAQQHFHEWFGNTALVTKAIPQATQRRAALECCGWQFIGTFRTFSDYYRIDLA